MFFIGQCGYFHAWCHHWFGLLNAKLLDQYLSVTRICFIVPALGWIACYNPLREVALLVLVGITSNHRLHRALEPVLHGLRVVLYILPKTNRTEIISMKVCPQTVLHRFIEFGQHTDVDRIDLETFLLMKLKQSLLALLAGRASAIHCNE